MNNQFPEPVKKAFNGVGKTLAYLYERWQDEKEFEDINSYGLVIEEHIEKIKGIVFLKMSKRPFGFYLRYDSKDYKIWCISKGNQINISMTGV